jgi:hypothetical protein
VRLHFALAVIQFQSVCGGVLNADSVMNRFVKVVDSTQNVSWLTWPSLLPAPAALQLKASAALLEIAETMPHST